MTETKHIKTLKQAKEVIEQLDNKLAEVTWDSEQEVKRLDNELYNANSKIVLLENDLNDDIYTYREEVERLDDILDQYERTYYKAENLTDLLIMQRLKKVLDCGRIDLLDRFLDSLPEEPNKVPKKEAHKESSYLEVEYLENEVKELREEVKELEQRADVKASNIGEEALIKTFIER